METMKDGHEKIKRNRQKEEGREHGGEKGMIGERGRK